jgi:divalent metal cation (Fe/Co/Zn/Cd) transporter
VSPPSAADLLARIRAAVSTHAEGAIEAHDLRSRHAGRLTFLEFHLVVPGSMTVAESHAICDRIEAALKSEMEHLVITIHVEPEAKAKQHGVPVL